MEIPEMSSQGSLTHTSFSLDALDSYKGFIASYLEEQFTLDQILTLLPSSGLHASACHFSHMLCKWGFFREREEYVVTTPYEHRIVIGSIAQKMANNMNFEEAERLWNSFGVGDGASQLFMQNRNPLAIVLLTRANAQYFQEQKTAYPMGPSGSLTSNLISELPKQPDRKVCMTCGERVDGVIYCSEQCRPSASLKLYSHRSTRAETPTITEGFRTARSRFMSPSADSCATYDTTQFVPPPYGLVDANPPTPKFVPTKEEPQEERGIEELPLYSGPEKGPVLPSVADLFDHWGTIKLPPLRSLLYHNNPTIDRVL